MLNRIIVQVHEQRLSTVSYTRSAPKTRHRRICCVLFLLCGIQRGSDISCQTRLNLYNREVGTLAFLIPAYPTGLEFCLLVLLTAERRWRTLPPLRSSDLLLSSPRRPLSAAPPIACCCLPPSPHRQGLLPAALCRRELQQLPTSSSALVGITPGVQATTPDERCRTCR